MIPSAPTVFESFNARPLRPEQVAKTFVAPDFFPQLTARSHSTIIGPRGSGKTSLLKMLQPRALESWNDPEADKYRSSIDFTGVFVATDISWNRQATAYVSGLSEEHSIALRGSAFTTQVLHSLIETFQWRTSAPISQVNPPYRRVNLSTDDERGLVRQLAESWLLSPKTDSLVGLKHSLSARNTEIWRVAQELALSSDTNTKMPKWLTLDFLACFNQAIEMFDDLAGESDSRWALLCDELELAPSWIMAGLLTAMRSVYQRILFKLALNPYDEQFEKVQDALRASPTQDYNEIILWQAKREDMSTFSEKLFLSVCQDQGKPIQHVEDLLGNSILEDDELETLVPAYAPGSPQWKQLKYAIDNDASFEKYWNKQKVDLNALNELSESVRAAKVRKVYPLVVLRNHFRPAKGSLQDVRQDRRGRKSLEAYRGASTMLAITEGNPRWIIGMTRQMLTDSLRTSLPIKAPDQAAILEETMHAFRARLKTISIGPRNKPDKLESLLSLVDKVGTYFSSRVIVGDFESQPYLTFKLNQAAPEELKAGIGRALNAGAIVYIPEKGSSGMLHDVVGKRFRLSYMLAPYYQLPLRLGGIALLEVILGLKNKRESTPNLGLTFE